MVAALLLAASLAVAPGFTEGKVLEPAASFVAGKPVVVACAVSTESWREWLVSTEGPDAPDAGGATYPGDSTIQLSPQVCKALRGRMSHLKRAATYSEAAAIQIITHESEHARGTTDEGVADCSAYKAVPYVATHFFGVKHYGPLQTFMSSVARFRRSEPATLHTAC